MFMGIGYQELLILLCFYIWMFGGTWLFGGWPKLPRLAFAYRYRGTRVATRSAAPSWGFAWIAIAVIVVLVVVLIVAE
jgi:hypothetical protein